MTGTATLSVLRAMARRLPRGMVAATLALSLLTGVDRAEARCSGIDLRDHLTDSARSRLDSDLGKVPFAIGNHWVATRGAQRIDIVGTQHSGDARMAKTMRQLRPLIRQADAVFLEVTETQMQAADGDQGAFARYFLLRPGQQLDRMMPAADWRLLTARLALYGITAEAAKRMQPWYISDFLTGTDCRKRGFGARRGLDDRIERSARNSRASRRWVWRRRKAALPRSPPCRWRIRSRCCASICAARPGTKTSMSPSPNPISTTG